MARFLLNTLWKRKNRKQPDRYLYPDDQCRLAAAFRDRHNAHCGRRIAMDTTTHTQAEMELITIYEIGKIINSSLDISRTFRESLNVLIMHMDFRSGMILLREAESELSLFAAAGLTQEEMARGHFRKGEGVIGHVFSSEHYR
jgi:transcriptional regulator with GAF, ATPase, and Fis domain